MSSTVALVLGVAAARRERVLRRRRVRHHLRPPQRHRAARPRGRPARHAPSCGRWSTSRSCSRARSWASRCARRASAWSPSRRSRTSSQAPLHALGRQREPHAPDLVRRRARDRRLPARRARRDGAQEPRRRRTRTAPSCCFGPPLVWVARVVRPMISALNWIANHTLRLVGVEPKDEVASAFTAQEVQSIVERSQAEGLLDDEQGLLTGALEFSDRTAADVMIATGALVTVGGGSTPEDVERLVARTGFSRFPVRRRRRGADGVPAPQGRPVRRRGRAAACRCRRGVSGRSRWSARRTRWRTRSRPCSGPVRTWRGSTRTVGPSVSCSSRTSSRSSSGEVRDAMQREQLS